MAASRSSRPAPAAAATNTPGKLRVVFLHPDLGLGGAERLIVDAACALMDHGHEVVVVTAHHDPNRSFDETNSRLTIKVAGDWIPRHIRGKLHLVFALLRTACAAWVHIVRPFLDPGGDVADVIVVDQIAQVVPFVKYLTWSPTLFYCHYPDKLLAPPAQSKARRLYRRVLDGLEERTTGMADSCLVNSHFTEGVFRLVFPRLAKMPLEVLNPCVDLESLNVVDPVQAEQQLPANLRHALQQHPLIFLSINRFERKKGIDLAIRATALVEEAFLVVAGGYDPRVEENCEHLAELNRLAVQLGIKNRVFFVPSVTHAAKALLLDLCIALLYTPQNEHFGIVPLEAAAAQRPVIACDSGGPRETVVNNLTGFLVEPTPEAFAQAMRAFLGPKGLNKAKAFGLTARSHVEGRFSKRAFGDRLDQIVVGMARPPVKSRKLRAWFVLIVACASIVLAVFIALFVALIFVRLAL